MTNATHHAIPLPDDTLGDLGENLLVGWQSVLLGLRHQYTATADKFVDEILICVSEKQINDALHRFVVQNVGMLHELYMNLHDDCLTLYATIDIKGIFTKVSCRFGLVGATLSADMQRFVFEQLSDTQIIEFYSKTWWYVPAVKTGVPLYRKLAKADPLPFLLQKIKVKDEPFAVHKGNIIYLDIHRYLANQKTMLGYLAKAQVNHAYIQDGSLLLKVQPNFGEILRFGVSGEDIITEKDNPNNAKKQRKD